MRLAPKNTGMSFSVPSRSSGEERPVVAHLTTAHSGRDVRIFAKMARSLATAGYAVCVIHPGDDTECVDGVCLKGMSLPKGRIARVCLGGVKVFLAAWRMNASLVHFHDPELLWVGVLWVILGRKAVYDVHEDVPQAILIRHWLPVATRPLVSWLADKAERILASGCSGVVAATPAIARRFGKARTVVVRNYPEDLDRFGVSEVEEAVIRPRVLYTGLLTLERGLRVMIEAAALVPARLHVELVLAGVIPNDDSRMAIDRAPEQVRYVGVLSRDAVIELYREGGIGLHVVAPLHHFMESLPIKMFEYMAAGMPIIVSDFPEWAEIVHQWDCGLLVDPTSPKALADGIAALLVDPQRARSMGANGQRAVRGGLSWESQTTALLDLYERLLPRAGWSK